MQFVSFAMNQSKSALQPRSPAPVRKGVPPAVSAPHPGFEEPHMRLRTNIGNVAALDDAVAAFNRTERIKGKTIIRVHP